MNEFLWKRIEEALDARIDPFSVPKIATALADDPLAARNVRRLVNRLDTLAESAPIAGIDAPATRSLRPVLLGAAAALVLAIGGSVHGLVDPGSSADRAHSERWVHTISLIVDRTTPPTARGARVVLESQPVTGWTLEGESP